MYIPTAVLLCIFDRFPLNKHQQRTLCSTLVVSKQWNQASQLLLHQKVLLCSPVQATHYFTSVLHYDVIQPIVLSITSERTLEACVLDNKSGAALSHLRQLIVNGHLTNNISPLVNLIQSSTNLESLTCSQFFLDAEFHNVILGCTSLASSKSTTSTTLTRHRCEPSADLFGLSQR